MSRVPSFLAGAALAAAIVLPLSFAGARQDAAGSDPMAEMMKKAEKYMRPGPNHAHLARFIGKWEVSTHLFHGDTELAGEPGTAEFSWLFEGRWLQQKGSGTMMRMPVQTFYLIGYDNLKQSFVTASVSTMDTAMITTEGDLDQHGKNLISYGTLDEYLTGEHDKPLKSVWRFISADEMVLEIHDLAIGETHTKVVEMRYTRAK